jgi:diguanylate cyclase (GGDEF)-like protein
MTPPHRFVPVNQILSRVPPAVIILFATGCVVLIGIPDFLIGTEISLSVFYLLPIGIATWYAGKYAGIGLALVSTVSYLASNIAAGHLYSRPGYMIWNGLLHLGFMLIVAFLLDTLHRALNREQQLARTDNVTGIANRLAFMERLRYTLALAARDARPVSLAYLDLDDFKKINDNYGHDAGDNVLRRVAQTVTSAIRRTDMMARIGGDEFALLLPDLNRQTVQTVIDKVCTALQQAFAAQQIKVNCSIGVVTFNAPTPDAEQALKAADLLMYEIKNQGRNAVAFREFHPDRDSTMPTIYPPPG